MFLWSNLYFLDLKRNNNILNYVQTAMLVDNNNCSTRIVSSFKLSNVSNNVKIT